MCRARSQGSHATLGSAASAQFRLQRNSCTDDSWARLEVDSGALAGSVFPGAKTEITAESRYTRFRFDLDEEQRAALGLGEEIRGTRTGWSLQGPVLDDLDLVIDLVNAGGDYLTEVFVSARDSDADQSKTVAGPAIPTVTGACL